MTDRATPPRGDRPATSNQRYRGKRDRPNRPPAPSPIPSPTGRIGFEMSRSSEARKSRPDSFCPLDARPGMNGNMGCKRSGNIPPMSERRPGPTRIPTLKPSGFGSDLGDDSGKGEQGGGAENGTGAHGLMMRECLPAGSCGGGRTSAGYWGISVACPVRAES